MAKQGRVARPTKSTEYEIRFGTREAEKGWIDLLATTKNGLTDAWDFLATDPTRVGPKNHTRRGALATVTRNGEAHERWQHELSGGARIWFYIDDKVVVLEQVHTHHPNATK
jgi:hypothetical protein